MARDTNDGQVSASAPGPRGARCAEGGYCVFVVRGHSLPCPHATEFPVQTLHRRSADSPRRRAARDGVWGVDQNPAPRWWPSISWQELGK